MKFNKKKYKKRERRRGSLSGQLWNRQGATNDENEPTATAAIITFYVEGLTFQFHDLLISFQCPKFAIEILLITLTIH